MTRPVPDPSQNTSQNRGSRTITRGRNDENQASEGGVPRRPGLDAKVKSSGGMCDQLDVPNRVADVTPDTGNESIILGPKTSFASTGPGRKNTGASDGILKSHTVVDDDETQKSRNGLRDLGAKIGLRSERNGDLSKDLKSGILSKTRGEHTDSESWSNGRRQKSSTLQEPAGSFRKFGERDEEKERASRNSGAEKPAWHSRKNEASWFRSDDSKDDSGNGGTGRSRDWRDKPRAGGFGDHTSAQEQDPEWMDEIIPEPEGKKQTHTQVDFEQWKARMKAGSGNHQQTDNAKNKESPRDAEPPTQTVPIKNGKSAKPLLVDAAFDDFLSLGVKPKKGNAPATPPDAGLERAMNEARKISKASKFSSLFSPGIPTNSVHAPAHAPGPVPAPAPAPAPAPEPPASPSAKDSSAEDKEGFARILSLLGQQQHSNPESSTGPVPRFTNNPSSPTQSRVNENYQGMDFFRQKSPPAAVPQSKDSQFLLNLMQQAQTRSNGPLAYGAKRPQSGDSEGLTMSNLVISPQESNRVQLGSAAGLPFNDMMSEEMRANEKTHSQVSPDRRLPPGLTDVPWAGPPRPSQMQFPQGMARPPGFDQFSPAFPNSRGPPPGFSGPTRINNGPPGLVSNFQAEPGSQFGVRPNGPGLPQQGFMNANGPPPGLSNLLFAQQNMPYGGGFGDMGHGAPGFGQPPQQQRR